MAADLGGCRSSPSACAEMPSDRPASNGCNRVGPNTGQEDDSSTSPVYVVSQQGSQSFLRSRVCAVHSMPLSPCFYCTSSQAIAHSHWSLRPLSTCMSSCKPPRTITVLAADVQQLRMSSSLSYKTPRYLICICKQTIDRRLV